MGIEKAELRIVKREVPSRMRAFRLMPTEDQMLEDYARTHEATVSDIVISALRQTGVLPESGSDRAIGRPNAIRPSSLER